jgi:hypothetical protein
MTKTIHHKEDSFRNSNIIKLLTLFSRNEKSEFGKFVHSPLNPRSEVTRFFDELKKYFPLFEKKDFSREVIFSRLYPGKKYRDDVIRRLSSNLFKLAEDFIAYKMFREDEYEQKNNVLRYYSNKNDDHFFWKEAAKLEAYLEKQPLRNEEYFFKLKRISTAKAYYISQYDATRKKFDNTQERITQTWHYSILGLLSTYDAAVNDMQIFNKKHNIDLLKPLLKLYKNPSLEKTSAAEIHYHSIMLNSESRTDETFFKLKTLLDENSGTLEKAELMGFYVVMHNYLFERSLIPGVDNSKLDFEITLKMLDLGLLTEKGNISAEWFVNVFLKAIRAGEIKFAEKFISDYESMLSANERSNVVNYAYAELEMTKKNFKKAPEYLAKIKFNNVWEKLRVNHMYVKIHYEINDSESFYYIIDSFRHILKDEPSVNSHTKEMYENFIKHVSKLYKAKTEESDISISQTKKEISNSRIAGNKWLIEKVNELENKNTA